MIVNNTHVLTLPLYTTTTTTSHAILTFIYTDIAYAHGMLQYTISNLPYSHSTPIHGPSPLNQ
ncbi:ADQ_G0016560.mRNA.1.CDS.1 [Saccharomyces cerevisiae]|nr:ADQ_G0016560.mRNA.1.CDS.1 [Saccharomyces cerevisiae]CAI6640056.1 ADQ_G0016560.mRNA.1.CDS.1 [Saccharomyces cerevisiae]